jgi:hyperosmotically inducible protein
MNPFQQILRYVMLGVLLLGTSACSEGSAEKMEQLIASADVAEEKPARPAESAGRRLTTRIKDIAISAQVKRKIMRERALRISDMDVTTHNRVVVLTGTVEKPEDATRAIQITQSVSDVESVDNRLAVRSGE